MGIGPTRPAWKAGILPLNYTRIRQRLYILPKIKKKVKCFFSIFRTFFIKLHIFCRADLRAGEEAGLSARKNYPLRKVGAKTRERWIKDAEKTKEPGRVEKRGLVDEDGQGKGTESEEPI